MVTGLAVMLAATALSLIAVERELVLQSYNIDSGVGARYVYAPVNGDQDGDLAYAPIFATSDGASVPVGVPPLSTVVVVFPKK